MHVYLCGHSHVHMCFYSPVLSEVTYVGQFSAAKGDSFQCDLEQYSYHKK